MLSLSDWYKQILFILISLIKTVAIKYIVVLKALVLKL